MPNRTMPNPVLRHLRGLAFLLLTLVRIFHQGFVGGEDDIPTVYPTIYRRCVAYDGCRPRIAEARYSLQTMLSFILRQ